MRTLAATTRLPRPRVVLGAGLLAYCVFSLVFILASTHPVPLPREDHLVTLASPVFGETALGKIEKRIMLEAGWSPLSMPDLPLRTIGQSCLPHPRKPWLSACHFHLVVLGVPKAGTTALAAFLMYHPQIRIPPMKESRVFERNRFVEGLGKGIMPFSELYLSDEDNSKQVNIDCTPNTLTHPSLLGCQRVAATLPPTSRFVVMLRDPLDRMLSEMKMIQRRGYLYTISMTKHLLKVWSEFSHCVMDIECDAREKVAQWFPPERRKSAQSAIQELRNEYVSDPVTVKACLGDADTLEKCLEVDQALGQIVLRSLHLSSSSTHINAHVKKNLEKAAPHRLVCNSCPRLEKLRSFVDVNRCVGCHCNCSQNIHAVRASLYRIMLDHCLEYLDRSRFLFIEMNELRRNSSAVLNRVIEHAGLAPFDFSNISSQQAEAEFDRRYGENRGYTHKDLVPEVVDQLDLPEALKAKARDFFAVDVSYLQELTGLDLKEWK